LIFLEATMEVCLSFIAAVNHRSYHDQSSRRCYLGNRQVSHFRLRDDLHSFQERSDRRSVDSWADWKVEDCMEYSATKHVESKSGGGHPQRDVRM